MAGNVVLLPLRMSLLQDGSQAARPHSAKFTEVHVADADANMKKAYADCQPLFKTLSEEFDPTGAFVNNLFARLFTE